MGEKNSVLVQNEKDANRAAAKVMRITFVMFTLIYLLNVVGIFVVDMGIMTLAYVAGSVLLWIPTLVVCVGKQQSTKDFLDNLVQSAPMHDIGKIGILDAILQKPGRLTPEEFDKMKEHPVIGGKIIEMRCLWRNAMVL